MFLVFYSTNDVFRAEDILNKESIQCEVVPTPVTDKAYCGVCIQTDVRNVINLMTDMEFDVID